MRETVPSAKRTRLVFDSTNLRKAWCNACVTAGLGTFQVVEGKPDKRYSGLIIHDLRRSAIRNLMKAGTSEKVAMAISGHKTGDVFDRYHIVDTQDVLAAMKRVQTNQNLVSDGASLVQAALPEPAKNR